MKNIFLTSVCIVVLSLGLRAQTVDCATGYCPATIIVHHKAGAVSPVTVPITYGVVANTYASGVQKCWITRNLGATNPAGSATDATDASAGWCWQFNRKQGYQMAGATRSPNTTWITTISEGSDFLPANDPCTLLLGSNWRLPTNSEWGAAITAGAFSSGYTAAYATPLKLHAAGFLLNSNGALSTRGSSGIYWSSTQSGATGGYCLNMDSGTARASILDKAYCFSVRCLRSY
jgi:hypothetical protein